MKKKIMLTMLVGGLSLSSVGIKYNCKPDMPEISKINKIHESYMNMHNNPHSNPQTITSTAQHPSDKPTVSVSSVVSDYFNPRNSHEWNQYKTLRRLMLNKDYATAIQQYKPSTLSIKGK